MVLASNIASSGIRTSWGFFYGEIFLLHTVIDTGSKCILASYQPFYDQMSEDNVFKNINFTGSVN